MKNQGIMFFIFVAFLSIGMVSCAVYSTTTTNRWLEYELPPSKIIRNGNEFFEGKLSSRSRFSVFYDNEIANDADYYYAILMQDFGWRSKNETTWTAQINSPRRQKIGHIYVNTSKGVAVYFSPPNGNYSAFKVSIK